MTTVTDAPSARENIWTGSETGSQMIAWDGSANGVGVQLLQYC